jgi:hypothetical protein
MRRTFEIRESEENPQFTVKMETDLSDRRDPPTRYTNNTTELYQMLQEWLEGGSGRNELRD